MPTLAELKAKWFLPMDGQSPDGIPQQRHSSASGGVSASTDGNHVQPLIDGEQYMTRWHNRITTLHLAPNSELYHAGWRFEGVKPLGHARPGPDALEDVANAKAGGVAVYPLTDRNLLCLAFNNATVIWLRAQGVWTAVMDNRFPPAGSNHQKFAVIKHPTDPLAVLGSIDISKTRWDTQAHLASDPNRNPTFGKQTHDTGVAVQGPALADIEITYRERWNDSTRTFGLDPLLPPQPLITTPVMSPSATTSNHSVQVLRTYGITSTVFGYSWSPRGEFTVWASYLNAIKNASTYIYIEDQYFLPFDWPPCHTRTGIARDTDILYQLGEAMKRGVRVAVVTPSNAEDSTHAYQKYQRDIGVNYLTSVKVAGAPGDVVVASLQNGGTDVYVHSKLMIVDDELLLIGSTNVGQRSMTYDGELHVAVVDGDGNLVREFRKALWAEHSGHAIVDPSATAYATFLSDIAASTGHLKPYPVDTTVVYPPVAGTPAPPTGHPRVIRTVVDPYAGPTHIPR
jgi:phosphatidylserine/phosphatidylglycerophosphate/cardiolipin synthase-like enzyme